MNWTCVKHLAGLGQPSQHKPEILGQVTDETIFPSARCQLSSKRKTVQQDVWFFIMTAFQTIFQKGKLLFHSYKETRIFIQIYIMCREVDSMNTNLPSWPYN